MRTVLHLSDLHFGRIDLALVEPLVAVATQLAPDLAVISGDLTQRARAAQFRDARAFLDRLPCPLLVVPGNHDVPLYNVVARFAAPLRGFRRYITPELYPVFEDDEIAALGINTARSLTRDRGSIDSRQVKRARAFFSRVSSRKVKIVVTHHPFDIPEDLSSRYMLRKAAQAMEVLSGCHADLFLAGHAHLCFAESSIRRYTTSDHASLIVQAGTGLSTRTRATPNSFNVLRIDRPNIVIEHWWWQPEQKTFTPWVKRQFRHSGRGWSAV